MIPAHEVGLETPRRCRCPPDPGWSGPIGRPRRRTAADHHQSRSRGVIHAMTIDRSQRSASSPAAEKAASRAGGSRRWDARIAVLSGAAFSRACASVIEPRSSPRRRLTHAWCTSTTDRTRITAATSSSTITAVNHMSRELTNTPHPSPPAVERASACARARPLGSDASPVPPQPARLAPFVSWPIQRKRWNGASQPGGSTSQVVFRVHTRTDDPHTARPPEPSPVHHTQWRAALVCCCGRSGIASGLVRRAPFGGH